MNRFLIQIFAAIVMNLFVMSSLFAVEVACEESFLSRNVREVTQIRTACFENWGNRSGAIALDSEICNCLKNDPLVGQDFSQALSTLRGTVPYESTAQQNFRLGNQNLILEDLRNGPLFHSSMLSAHPGENANILQLYAQNYLENTNLDGINEANRRLPETIGRYAIRDNERSILIPTFNASALEAISENSCVNQRDFAAYLGIPKNDEFYKDVAGMSSFQPEDWNASALRDQIAATLVRHNISFDTFKHDTDYKSAPADVVKAADLLDRLEFLNRNPLFKSLFQLPGTGANGASVRAAQQRLFSGIKTQFNLNCLNGGDTYCRHEAAQRGSLQILNAEMSDTFKDPSIAAAIAEANMAEWNSRIEGINDQLALPDNLRPNIMATLEITDVDPEVCAAPASLPQCYEGMKRYCSAQSLALSNRAAIETRRPHLSTLSDIDKYIAWGSPLSQEGSFAQFQTDICQTRRTSDSTPPRQANYAEYRAQNCPANATHDFCQPNNQRLLLGKFLRAFPFGEHGDSFAETNEARGFEKFLSGKPIAQIENKAVLAAARENFSYEGYSSFTSGLGEIFRSSGKISGTVARGSSNLLSSTLGSAGSMLKSAVTGVGQVAPAIAPSALASSPQVIVPLTAPVAAVAAPVVAPDFSREREEISELRERIAQNQSAAQISPSARSANSALQNRLQELEARLLRDDVTIPSSSVPQTRSPASAPQIQPQTSEVIRDQARVGSQVSAAGAEGPRGMASVGGALASAGSVSGGSSLSASSVARMSAINDALLSKYGLTTQGASERNGMIVVSDREARDLTNLNASAGSIPLSVSSEIYSGLERDAAGLQSFHAQIMSNPASIVKLSVNSPGRMQLEFYAIKEAGQIIIQPIRRSTLNDLRMNLQ